MTKTRRFSCITGAAGLLGTQFSDALCSINHNLLLIDNNEARLTSLVTTLSHDHPSVDIIPFVGDITDPSTPQSALSLLPPNSFVDVLINNACIDFKPKENDYQTAIHPTRLESFTKQQWDIELNVGLYGAVNMIQTFGPIMADHNRGSIINIASDLSIISPDQRLYSNDPHNLSNPVKPITYSVIKSALLGLTKYVSTYWANSNVRCNSLSPGGVFNNQPDEFVSRLRELIP